MSEQRWRAIEVMVAAWHTGTRESRTPFDTWERNPQLDGLAMLASARELLVAPVQAKLDEALAEVGKLRTARDEYLCDASKWKQKTVDASREANRFKYELEELKRKLEAQERAKPIGLPAVCHDHPEGPLSLTLRGNGGCEVKCGACGKLLVRELPGGTFAPTVVSPEKSSTPVVSSQSPSMRSFA